MDTKSIADEAIDKAYKRLEDSAVSGAARESLYSSAGRNLAREMVEEARESVDKLQDAKLAERAEEIGVSGTRGIIVHEVALFLHHEVLQAEINTSTE